MEIQKKWFFSLFSGEIYEVELDLIKHLDAFQLPLKEKPNCVKCKKCHGRLHEGYNIIEKAFVLCKPCGRKYVDLEAMLRNDKN